MLEFMNLKGKKGITILALAIMIIILLILAGISISALTGDNGLIANAGNAKEQAEIDGEKEILEISTVQAIGKDKYGNVQQTGLQTALDSNAGDGKTEVIDSGDILVVKFIESKRYYEVDGNGNISEPITINKDEYVGDLTKGGRCDGSEAKPYEINCIEDLVAFSIMNNGGNSELGLSSNNFSNKYVILTRTLDFKSIFSYNDYTSKIYGDLNTDGTIENIRTELTKTDEGCIGFTGIKNFQGIFDGKENSIENIYQNNSSSGGLFNGNTVIKARAKEIKNLTLTGNIISQGWATGIGEGETISNCKNYANVTGTNMVSGITLYRETDSIVTDCENYGTIEATYGGYAYTGAGGIVAYVEDGGTISNCANYGKIRGKSNCGGILGSIHDDECTILNCINYGESDSGLIAYIHSGTANIFNSCNLGNTSTGILGNAGLWLGTLNISNCYNVGKSSKAIVGYKGNNGTINVTNTYYDQTKSTSAGAITEGIEALNEEDIKNNEIFVEILNNNIGENTEWKSWKIGEDGYPTFE